MPRPGTTPANGNRTPTLMQGTHASGPTPPPRQGSQSHRGHVEMGRRHGRRPGTVADLEPGPPGTTGQILRNGVVRVSDLTSIHREDEVGGAVVRLRQTLDRKLHRFR